MTHTLDSEVSLHSWLLWPTVRHLAAHFGVAFLTFHLFLVTLTTAKDRFSGAQRAKFAKKVHKPPLRVNVISFELNGFNASIWVPWSLPDPKKL